MHLGESPELPTTVLSESQPLLRCDTHDVASHVRLSYCIAALQKANKILAVIKRNLLTGLQKRLWHHIKVMSDHI